MIKVNFRVTGIFVGSTSKEKKGYITVEVKDNPTVYDVMVAVSKAAKDNTLDVLQSFTFVPALPDGAQDIKEIHAVFNDNPRGNRKAGLYFLVDGKVDNVIRTFQYYIYDQEFRQLNNNGKSRRFNEEPDGKIEDGYTVVIRQICIYDPVESNAKIFAEIDNLQNQINQI